MTTIDVILPLAIADTYTYRVPEEIENPQIGMRVLVPLSKREMVGIVERVTTDDATAAGSAGSGVVIRDMITALDADPIVTARQLKLWRWIAGYYLCPIGAVMAAALPSNALDRQYILSESSRRRVKLKEYTGETEPIHTLDNQQAEALTKIESEVTGGKDVVLLHGVTGSGKTEVYIHLIDKTLREGRQVLYLVPEIALTTQLTDRLQRVFGNQCLVYHSRISEGQRMEIYRQLLLTESGEKPRVIIGARSAIFLPLRNLGLIIVDEEHETSYKQQDPAPRYHARDVAIVMAQMYGKGNSAGGRCKVILGTATPSVETYHNALEGKYGLVEMTERYKGLELPEITMIDLGRQYHRKEMYGHFSDPLVARIREELGKGKQVILFQNRRGYAPYLSCVSCGKALKCDNCDVSMTVHKRSNSMICHYCGTSMTIPTKCSHCGGEMRLHGFGTERLEEEVETLFPGARVQRMDLDTTRKKDDYQEIIDRFSRHECDILIGTQMVSKGLHFDDVSLVAVLNADHMLNQPDFRSYERAFQMLEQVSGRAGRTGKRGEVFLQSFDPEHPVLSLLGNHDYMGMYAAQDAERKMFRFPPYFRLIRLTLRHTNLSRLEIATRVLQERLNQAFGSQRCSKVLEPGVSRVQQKYIRQIQLRIEQNGNLDKAKRIIRDQIAYVMSMPDCKGIEILPDVDPM